MSASETLVEQGPSFADLAAQLKALGDETRLELMLTIASSRCKNGACICDLTPRTQLSQSTVSHHMKLLVDAGLLSRTQQGKQAYFDLTPEGESLLAALGISAAGCSCKNCCVTSSNP